MGKELVLLGARDVGTGQELDTSDADVRTKLGVPVWVRTPREFAFDSLEHCIQMAFALSAAEEGFVVVDSQYRRVKVKSPAYVAVHYHATRLSVKPEHLVAVVLDGEQKEFCCYAKPDQVQQLRRCEEVMRATTRDVCTVLHDFITYADRSDSNLKKLKAQYVQFVKQREMDDWFSLFMCLFDKWVEAGFQLRSDQEVWVWLTSSPKCRATWKNRAQFLLDDTS